jgi:hypothetical protein
MSELKAGQTTTFDIEGQTLTVEPIPYGNLKKILRIVTEAAGKLGKQQLGDNFLAVVPTIFEEYLDQFIPLLFKKAKHPFLTKEWYEDNLTIPQMKEIMLAAIAVNGLQDFFDKTVKAPAPAAVPSSSGTTPILPESSGSTISSDSPTDGGPKT